MMTRVADPVDNLGMPWQDVANSDLTEVWARFTEENVSHGAEAVRNEGDPVEIMSVVLVLRRQGDQWRAHTLIDSLG